VVVIDGTTERITLEVDFHIGSITVVKSSASCAMQEPVERMGPMIPDLAEISAHRAIG
jgi:hypothetical protein